MVAPLATEIVPPATVIPRLAVKVSRSKIPALTIILPVADVVEFKAGKLAASCLVPAPLIFNVE